jgi:hypothetical protein
MPDEPVIRADLPEVLVVPESTSGEALAAYFAGGSMPDGAHGETFEEFSARGRVSDCDCNLIQCVCTEARQHRDGCQYRLALTCAVAIRCKPHRKEVCPECDPCPCFSKLGSG